ENQNQVVIAPQAGLVENGIAYGVLISGSQGGGSDLDSGFNSVLQQIISSQQGSKQIGGTESISVNKVPARMAYLRGVSPVSSNGKQLSERDWVVGLPRGNDILYLIFIAPEGDFEQLRPTYENMLRSFKVK